MLSQTFITLSIRIFLKWTSLNSIKFFPTTNIVSQARRSCLRMLTASCFRHFEARTWYVRHLFQTGAHHTMERPIRLAARQKYDRRQVSVRASLT